MAAPKDAVAAEQAAQTTMTTAEACVEAYLAEQAARPAPTQILRRPDAPAAPSPADNKAAKQRALLQRQVEALFSDEALVALGRQRLAQLRDAGKYCMSLKDLAARSWKGVPWPSVETLREALLASAVVDIVDEVVERSLVLETDLLAQYDMQLRRQVSYLFSDANLQSCPPAKLRAMLDEDEETLFLPLVAVVATKKVKELLKHETDKVQACRAALDAAAPGTMICAVADHAAGPRVVRTQDLSDELWACAFRVIGAFDGRRGDGVFVARRRREDPAGTPSTRPRAGCSSRTRPRAARSPSRTCEARPRPPCVLPSPRSAPSRPSNWARTSAARRRRRSRSRRTSARSAPSRS